MKNSVERNSVLLFANRGCLATCSSAKVLWLLTQVFPAALRAGHLDHLPRSVCKSMGKDCGPFSQGPFIISKLLI